MHWRNSFIGLLLGTSFLKDSVICTGNWFLSVLQRPAAVPAGQGSGGCDRPLLHELSFRRVLSSQHILPKVASLESCGKWRHPTSKPCPPHDGWHGGWVKGWVSCSVVSDSCDSMDCSPPGSSVQGIAQARIPERVVIGKNTGMGCHFLLLGIFPTRGLNPRLLHSGGSPALQVDSLLTEPPYVIILLII